MRSAPRRRGVAALPPFELLLDRIGSFSAGRVVWIGCRTPPPQLVQLHRELGEALAACRYRVEGSADVHPAPDIAPPCAWTDRTGDTAAALVGEGLRPDRQHVQARIGSSADGRWLAPEGRMRRRAHEAFTAGVRSVCRSIHECRPFHPALTDPGPGMPAHRIGCAGWSILSRHAALFGEGDSHLARYATRFNAVEINSSFYRPHAPRPTRAGPRRCRGRSASR